MYLIDELLKQHQIILIQEHWLFETQINTIGDLNKNINFVGKGVIKYNPVLPKSMPRGYLVVFLLNDQCFPSK
jgi:hypothetical protein